MRSEEKDCPSKKIQNTFIYHKHFNTETYVVEEKNHVVLIFCNKLTISFNNLCVSFFLYDVLIMIFSTFNMVMFKCCCHGNELIDLYWKRALLTQDIVEYHSYHFIKNRITFARGSNFLNKFVVNFLIIYN